MKSRGFTLIELLVVISIIAMLSSVVLANIKIAKDKASNVEATEMARQYIFAINNINLDYGSGAPLTEGNGISVCISDIPTGMVCLLSHPSATQAFKDKLDLYIKRQVMGNFMGPSVVAVLPLYSCTSIVGSQCKSYTLYWHMKGLNNACPFGATAVSAAGITTCTFSGSF